MAATRQYQKAQAAPEALAFFSDLSRMRQLVAEFTARYSTTEPAERAADACHVNSSQSVYALVGEEMAALAQENLRVVVLNTKYRVLDVVDLYRGTLLSSQVRVAEVFRPAIIANAAAIIVVHNHPSGDPAPSPEDVRVTTALVAAGKLLDIEVLDHVIVGAAGRYISMKERRLGFE